MIVLGINSAYHETSAAILVDGEIVAAAEEERFNRFKHGAEARIDNPDELPIESIEYCLQAAGISGAQVDAVGFSFDPDLRTVNWEPDPYARPNDWGDPDGEALFLSRVRDVPKRVSVALGSDLTDRFHWVEHHVAHAASAYYPSRFDGAAFMVVDGIGENSTSLLGYGTGSALEPLERTFYPNSLGFVWEKICTLLGFSEYDASKLMGLAAYGDHTRYLPQLRDIVATTDEGTIVVDADAFQFRRPGAKALEALFGTVEGAPGEDPMSRDLAAALQHLTNDVMLRRLEHLHGLYPAEAVCLAGGVALNCTTNWILKEQGPYEELYVPSAPHDAGTAIGAALYPYHQAFGRPVPDGAGPANVYLGPEYGDAEIRSALAAASLPGREVSDPAREAARLVADGAIVGWFQGRLEFGPRALGNRSLLADPRSPHVRELLNAKVKHREPFRPFAPSILAEHADEWLTMGRNSESYHYMLFAPPVRPEKRSAIPAVVHADGTARAQIVTKESNPQYHALISHFAEMTGVPLVLNTSFNDSEPIVCSPEDAVNTFLNTRIDALVLGRHVVERSA